MLSELQEFLKSYGFDIEEHDSRLIINHKKINNINISIYRISTKPTVYVSEYSNNNNDTTIRKYYSNCKSFTIDKTISIRMHIELFCANYDIF